MNLETEIVATNAIDAVVEGTSPWCVVHADNADVLPLIPDRGVTHVITDPPFTSRTSKNARTNHNWAPQSDAHAFIDFDGVIPGEFVSKILRVSSRWVVAFCALEQLGEYATAAGEKQWVRAGVWGKPDGAPKFTGDRPAQAAEGIAIMHRPGKMRWNGGGSRGLWLHSVVQSRAEFDHPTPKPLDLMLDLVELFTDPGDVVLDPFCGSGTTGVACIRLGRRFIGIEKNAKYATVAQERLAAESQGLNLRDARAGQLPMFGGAK